MTRVQSSESLQSVGINNNLTMDARSKSNMMAHQDALDNALTRDVSMERM